MSNIHRLPPGQRLLANPSQFPILDLGVQPDWDPSTYKFIVNGAVENPISLSYQELISLPKQSYTADFHCVTRWSRYDIHWTGIPWSEIEKLVRPKAEAKYVIQSGLEGYTTNSTVAELRQGDAFLAFKLEGQPLPKDHGAPVRMIIPHLYGWKGAKFLTQVEYMPAEKKGFWEVRGYHNHGDPWQEERYS